MSEHNLRIFFRLDLDEALGLSHQTCFRPTGSACAFVFCIYIHIHMFIIVSLYMNRHKHIHKKTHIHWNTDAQRQPPPPPHPHVPTFLCINRANIQVAYACMQDVHTDLHTHTYSSTLTWAFTHHHKHSSTTTTRRRRHSGVQNTSSHEPQVHILQKLIHFNPHRSTSHGLGMARSGLACVSLFVSCKCDPHFSVHPSLHDSPIWV